MTPEVKKLIEDRADIHAELNYGGTWESPYVKVVSYHSFVAGAKYMASISYSKENVDALIEDIKAHSFSQELALQALNDFTSKYNPDETNTQRG